MNLSAIAQYFFIFFAALLYLPAHVLGEGLIITDCHGFTRAIHNVDATELCNVEVAVSHTAGGTVTGTKFTLTNAVSGEEHTATAKNGLVTFSNIPAGTFSLATTASNTAIGIVSISSTGFLPLVATGAFIATGTAAAGSAVVIGNVVHEEVFKTGGSSTEATPEPTPAPTPRPQPSAAATPQATPRPPAPTPRPTPECTDCDPDEIPPPLDDGDFFRDQHTQATQLKRAPLSPHS